MPNRAIELHDTTVERVERAGGNLVLWLSAYMHESEGRPGQDPGTGWILPARLVIEHGEWERPCSSGSLWITEGRITVSGRLYDNLTPLPFDERGQVYMSLSGAEGEYIISGERAHIEPAGEPRYIEKFP